MDLAFGGRETVLHVTAKGGGGLVAVCVKNGVVPRRDTEGAWGGYNLRLPLEGNGTGVVIVSKVCWRPSK